MHKWHISLSDVLLIIGPLKVSLCQFVVFVTCHMEEEVPSEV